MSTGLINDKSTLVQVMAWCHQATSHYLSQCWPISMLPYGVNKPQCIYSDNESLNDCCFNSEFIIIFIPILNTLSPDDATLYHESLCRIPVPVMGWLSHYPANCWWCTCSYSCEPRSRSIQRAARSVPVWVWWGCCYSCPPGYASTSSAHATPGCYVLDCGGKNRVMCRLPWQLCKLTRHWAVVF